MKVKAYDPVVVESMGSCWSGSESALPGSRVVVSCSWTAAGSSLYIHRLRPAVYRIPMPTHTRVRLGFYLFLSYNTSYISHGSFMSMGPNPPLGFVPLNLYSKASYSLSSWASIRMTPYVYNPAPHGRFILSSYIPNKNHHLAHKSHMKDHPESCTTSTSTAC